MKILIYVEGALYIVFGLCMFTVKCKLVQQISKFDNSLSIPCLQNLSMLKEIRVIFFGLHSSENLIKYLMSFGTSVIVEMKSPGDSTGDFASLDCGEDSTSSYLAVTENESLNDSSLRLVIPKKCVAYGRNFYFYRAVNKQSPTEGKECYLQSLNTYDFLPPLSTEYCKEIFAPKKHYYCSFPLNGSLKKNNVDHKHRRLPDMMGTTIEVVTFHRPIATVIHSNESDPTKRYDGLEMNIFIEIAKKLNMTWRVNELEGELDKWGQWVDGSWRGGMMGALTSGSAEVGFSTIWISPLQTPHLDYTTSWTNIALKFLVPKPEVVEISWESLVRPFTLPVWVAVAFSFLLFPICAWITVHIHLEITQEKLPGKKKYSDLGSYIMYTLGSITGGSGMLGQLKGMPARFLVSWWYIFIVLICSSYTSKIMACLTLPYYTPRIDSVEQLVQLHFAWGRPYSEDNLFKHLDHEKYWHREFAKNFIVYNKTHLTPLLMSKRFVLNVQQIESCDYIVMDHPIKDEIAEYFRVMKEKITSYRCAIALRKHSPLLHSFNMILERLIEAGLVHYFKDDAARRFQRPAYKHILVEVDSGIKSTEIAALTFENYKFMFYLYFFGLLISTVCFLIELCVKEIVIV